MHSMPHCFEQNSGIHVSQANCKQGHVREALCCKTGAQYAEYFRTVSKRDPALKPYRYMQLYQSYSYDYSCIKLVAVYHKDCEWQGNMCEVTHDTLSLSLSSFSLLAHNVHFQMVLSFRWWHLREYSDAHVSPTRANIFLKQHWWHFILWKMASRTNQSP